MSWSLPNGKGSGINSGTLIHQFDDSIFYRSYCSYLDIFKLTSLRLSISPIYDSVIILWDRISVFLESLTPPFLYFSSSCLSSWFSFSNEMTELCFYLCNSLILFYKIYIFLTNSYFSCWFYNILPESTGLVVFWITFSGMRPFTGLWAYGITLVRELEGLIR